MKIECKKCDKEVEFPEGLIDEKKIIEITTFIKHHKKHGIFAWHQVLDQTIPFRSKFGR